MFTRVIIIMIQVSITLIATGFKRQEESDGRPLQVFSSTSLCMFTPHANPVYWWASCIICFMMLQGNQLAQGDANLGINRRPSSFLEGGSVEIPEFLRKKGGSRYPRA